MNMKTCNHSTERSCLNVDECAQCLREQNGPMLSKDERYCIYDILTRRANEIAGYLSDYRKDKNYFGSVELALTREIDRLRQLADRVNPKEQELD